MAFRACLINAAQALPHCAEAPELAKAEKEKSAVSYKCCSPCRAHPRFFWTALSYRCPLVLHPWKWIIRDISNHNPRSTWLSSLKQITDKWGDKAQGTKRWVGCGPFLTFPFQSTHMQKDPPNMHSFLDPHLPHWSASHLTQHLSVEILWCATQNQLLTRTEESHRSKSG